MKTIALTIFLCLTLNTSLGLAEDVPSFNNNILSIPNVDTSDKIAKYQNVQFKLAPDGRWDLLKATEYKTVQIDTLDLKVTETFPVQVFAVISGNLPNGCYGLGQINQRRLDNRFELSVSRIELQTFAVCTQALVPFKETIPLEVYNLPTGSYEVNVNGKSAGFSLSKNNSLAAN